MSQTAIFRPVFATLLYVRRIHFLTSNRISSADSAARAALHHLGAT